jgi:hypothetical protein
VAALILPLSDEFVDLQSESNLGGYGTWSTSGCKGAFNSSCDTSMIILKCEVVSSGLAPSSGRSDNESLYVYSSCYLPRYLPHHVLTSVSDGLSVQCKHRGGSYADSLDSVQRDRNTPRTFIAALLYLGR